MSNTYNIKSQNNYINSIIDLNQNNKNLNHIKNKKTRDPLKPSLGLFPKKYKSDNEMTENVEICKSNYYFKNQQS